MCQPYNSGNQMLKMEQGSEHDFYLYTILLLAASFLIPLYGTNLSPVFLGPGSHVIGQEVACDLGVLTRQRKTKSVALCNCLYTHTPLKGGHTFAEIKMCMGRVSG